MWGAGCGVLGAEGVRGQRGSGMRGAGRQPAVPYTRGSFSAMREEQGGGARVGTFSQATLVLGANFVSTHSPF